MKKKYVQVTMSKEMRDILLHGKKSGANEIGFRGCGTEIDLNIYVEKMFCLLGHGGRHTVKVTRKQH